jgi:hypothetical protein
MQGKPIYAETTIQSELATLWKYSQAPELHERGDLPFTRITYLPKAGDDEPKRFTY